MPAAVNAGDAPPMSLFARSAAPDREPASRTYDVAAPEGADHERATVAPVTALVRFPGLPGGAVHTPPTVRIASFDAALVPAALPARTRT